MILSVKDRLVFGHLFSANKDSMTEAAVQRSIIKLISIDHNEATIIRLKTAPGGQLVWDAQKGNDKTFEFTDVQKNYLKETIYTLSKAGGITQDILPLGEKIHML